jgi:O-antigen/teichoic acid export membrane protein
VSDSPVASDGALLGGYARGVAWTYLSVLLTGASTFFLAGWTVRRVGTAEFGQFAVVASVSGLLAMVDYALGLAVQRASARVEAGSPGAEAERDSVHAAHGAFVVVGAAVALVSLASGAALAAAGPARMPRLPATVVLFGLATALQLATAALPAVAAGSRRFSLRAPATLAGVAVRVVVAVAAVGRFGVPALALAHLLGVAADRLVLLGLLRGRVPWFDARPARPRSRALAQVLGFALPLLVLNVSAQLFAVVDLVVIGALVGAAASGLYQVASLLPLQLAALLMIGYNVAFPALSGTDDAAGQEAATRFLTGVAAYAAGTGLVLAALLRADVIEVVLGRPSAVAEDVVAIFCAVCLANVMLHGLVALLIARGHQSAVARLVAIELPVNVILTVWLVVALGAPGAALATLATVVLMDFAVFPALCGPRLAFPVLGTIVRHGLAPAALGGAAAAVAATLAGALAGAGAPRLATGALLAAGIAVAAGLAVLGPAGRATLRGAFAADRRAPAPAL